MSDFDLFILLLKKALRTVWICVIFAFLFAINFFTAFAAGDLLEGLQKNILKEIGSEYCDLECVFDEDTDVGGADIGIYYTSFGNIAAQTIRANQQTSAALLENSTRGISMPRVLSIWKKTLKVSARADEEIWLYVGYAATLEINAGDAVSLSSKTEKTYTVAGTYDSKFVNELRSGFIPSFIIFAAAEAANARVVVAAQDVLTLFRSELGKSLTDGEGITEMCAGYELSKMSFSLLLAVFIVVSVLIATYLMLLFHRHFSRQTFLLRAFGLSAAKCAVNYFAVLMVFGIISLCLAIGLFFAFYGITAALAGSIMNMMLGESSVLLHSLIGFLIFAALGALAETTFYFKAKSAVFKGVV